MLHSSLLKRFHQLFNPQSGPVLDLACGKGQNGLYLKQYNIDVIFADIQQHCLNNLIHINNVSPSHCWHADFETKSIDNLKLAEMSLQGVIVFKYLHRPLFPAIKAAIKPGGFVIYETFTTDNRKFGRPNRDAFLLKSGELKTLFEGWEILFYFEGIKANPDRAIAQIICKKPLL